MRDATEMTEHEAKLLNDLIRTYPNAEGYRLDRDPPVHAVARDLIEEGRVERTEIAEHGVVAYRLTDDYAAEIRRVAAERAAGADLN